MISGIIANEGDRKRLGNDSVFHLQSTAVRRRLCSRS